MPRNAGTENPACSNALWVTSSNKRCCGSSDSVSVGEMPKKCGSNCSGWLKSPLLVVSFVEQVGVVNRWPATVSTLPDRCHWRAVARSSVVLRCWKAAAHANNGYCWFVFVVAVVANAFCCASSALLVFSSWLPVLCSLWLCTTNTHFVRLFTGNSNADGTGITLNGFDVFLNSDQAHAGNA